MASDTFGQDVEVSGDTMVVGAPARDGKGAAFVFVRSNGTWSQQQILQWSGSDPTTSGDLFGQSVSISGDTIIVGARGDDNQNGGDAGAAYIFRRTGSTWTGQTKLVPWDGRGDDVAGSRVDIDGNTVVVSAHWHDAGGGETGAAYTWSWNGSSWVQGTKLLASDRAASHHFGTGVSISGDTIVVGADTSTGATAGSGSAYVFVWNGSQWIEDEKVYASDGAGGDGFSPSEIRGDIIISSARFNDNKGTNAGAAYVHRRP